MKNKNFTQFTKMLLVVTLFVFIGLNGWGQQLAIYEFSGTSSGDNQFNAVTSQPTGATFSTFTRTGVNWGAAANVFNSTNWSLAGINLAKYVTFTITPSTGYSMTLTELNFFEQRSGTGPVDWAVRSSLDGYTTDITTGSGTISPGATHTFSLPGASFTDLTSAVTFRVYGYTASGAGGTLRLDNVFVNGVLSADWTGTTSSDWSDGTNWGTGFVPTSTDNVRIASVPINQPQITTAIGFPALCKALLINAGATLIIEPGSALTASGPTTNDGIFTIESDATGIGSFIDNGTITGIGTFNVKNYLTGSGGPTPNGRYWYIGSPVTGALSGVFDAMGDNRLWYYDEVAGNYSEVITNGISLNVMQGFVARLGATETINFTGTLNTGDQTYPLTATSPSTYEGFNLVCNPFPSAVNLLNVSTPPTNLENTVWYRSGSTFATYNYMTSASTNGGTEFVPSMQSFWVKVTSGQTTGSVTLNNSARTHSTQAYYKTASASNVFSMSVSDGTSNDETVIGFYQDAQDVFENYDSRKMMSDDAPQLYSLTSDMNKVAINGQPDLTANEERIVPLGFKTNAAGTFTLDASKVNDFDATISVYLEDTQLSVIQDLRQSNTYTFTSAITDDANRFKVHFGNMTTAVPTITESAVSAYAVDNTIYVNTPKTASIKVYDVLGNLIMTQNSTQGLNTLHMNVDLGIYIVTIQTGTQVTTQKVMISK